MINVAGVRGDQMSVAPGGAGFVAGDRNFETPANPQHPFFTGEGYGGEALTQSDFIAWGPVDRGELVALPSPPPTVLLRNGTTSVSMIEYPYGDGKVILTSLNFCANGTDGPDRQALENLLKYGRFYQGAAQTPAPTVTSTPTPTNTPAPPTGTVTLTPTITPTLASTSTPSRTPTPEPLLRGDVNGDGEVNEIDLSLLIRLIFERSGEGVAGSDIPPAADVNADDRITTADLLALASVVGEGAGLP